MAGHRRLLSKSEQTDYRTATVIKSYEWGAYTDQERQTKTDTVEIAEIVGLTQAQALALSPTEGWEITNRNRTNAVFWTVTEQRVTDGTWAAEE